MYPHLHICTHNCSGVPTAIQVYPQLFRCTHIGITCTHNGYPQKFTCTKKLIWCSENYIRNCFFRCTNNCCKSSFRVFSNPIIIILYIVNYLCYLYLYQFISQNPWKQERWQSLPPEKHSDQHGTMTDDRVRKYKRSPFEQIYQLSKAL